LGSVFSTKPEGKSKSGQLSLRENNCLLEYLQKIIAENPGWNRGKRIHKNNLWSPYG